jgi:hypothetical protein
MANEKKLIYADDARRAILETDPKLVYCIERIKAVDAVEVVRCKDCKWWSFDYCTNRNGAGGLIFNGDWFCRSGERKDNVET